MKNTRGAKAADVLVAELLVIRDEIDEALLQKRPIQLEPMQEWKQKVAKMVAEAEEENGEQ